MVQVLRLSPRFSVPLYLARVLRPLLCRFDITLWLKGLHFPQYSRILYLHMLLADDIDRCANMHPVKQILDITVAHSDAAT